MTDIVLAPSTSIETTTDATAIAPQRPYVEPRRLDVPASVVRELLQAAGLGTGCAKATLVVQPTYSTNAAALSWCEGSKDDVVVLTRAAGRWEAQELSVTVNRAGSVGLTMTGKNAARLLPRMLGL